MVLLSIGCFARPLWYEPRSKDGCERRYSRPKGSGSGINCGKREAENAALGTCSNFLLKAGNWQQRSTRTGIGFILVRRQGGQSDKTPRYTDKYQAGKQILGFLPLPKIGFAELSAQGKRTKASIRRRSSVLVRRAGGSPASTRCARTSKRLQKGAPHRFLLHGHSETHLRETVRIKSARERAELRPIKEMTFNALRSFVLVLTPMEKRWFEATKKKPCVAVRLGHRSTRLVRKLAWEQGLRRIWGPFAGERRMDEAIRREHSAEAVRSENGRKESVAANARARAR